MASRISVTLSNNYGKLIGILPDEMANTETENDLRSSKQVLDLITQEDLNSIDHLLRSNNFSLPLQEFSQPQNVIKRALTLKQDLEQEYPYQSQIDEIQFYVAQWWIRKDIIGGLAQAILDGMC